MCQLVQHPKAFPGSRGSAQNIQRSKPTGRQHGLVTRENYSKYGLGDPIVLPDVKQFRTVHGTQDLDSDNENDAVISDLPQNPQDGHVGDRGKTIRAGGGCDG
jgi:hypothetical protein